MYHFAKKSKRIIIGAFLAIFVFIQMFGFIILAQPARAFPVEDIPMMGFFTGDKVSKSIMSSMVSAGMSALMSGFNYFLRKLAYDGAMYLASGGKGQGAMAFKNGFGSYIQDTALNSAATAIDQLGKPFGLNLCQTPDVKLQLYLQINLRSLYPKNDKGGGGENGPQPDCSWQKLKGAWSGDAFTEKYGANGEKFKDQLLGNMIRTGGDDFSLALGADAAVDRIQAKATTGNIAERAEGQGWKALKGLISGNIKTPASIPKLESEALSGKQQSQNTNQQAAGIYGQQGLQVIFSALSLFLNTFTSQLLQKLLGGGFFDDSGEGGGSGGEGSGGAVGDFYAEWANNNRQAAQNAFNFLLTNTPSKQTDYPLTTEFFSCPDNPGLNNCVIEEDFQKILTRAKSEDPLTVQKALDEKLLHADWPLVSPFRAENSETNCREGHYCYSNLQKLRKAGILPLGFEITALKADPDNPQNWTLGKVVENFYNCQKDADKNFVVSAKYPYCHLINPNWVIKAPVVRCENKVNGPMLQSSEGPQRREECVDYSTCLNEDEKGTCLDGTYGYCLKAKNIWRLKGKSCPADFSTCKTFTADGGSASYLSRTLDYGECSLSNLGCRGYSVEQSGVDKDGNGLWISTAEKSKYAHIFVGRNPVLYFNSKIDTASCFRTDDGCRLFYQAVKSDDGFGSTNFDNTYDDNNKVRLKRAPDYLGCYDINTTTVVEINWPKTRPELSKLTKDGRCKNYAQVCLPDEVGCEMYTPADGNGPPIPGVVGDQNFCPEECNGYNTFKQKATTLAPEAYPLYFIPQNGKQCSEVGCDEFTNLEESTKGGEKTEYYSELKYCERPDGQNEKVYYSWQGSETEGYVLKTHKMKPVDVEEQAYVASSSPLLTAEFPAGSPAYVDDSPTTMLSNHLACNKDNYNLYINNQYDADGLAGYDPDCRALYDKTGNIYYRLLKNSITISNDCHPLRKTEANLESAPDITLKTPTICQKKGGFWNGQDCLRCFNGGKYDNGLCIYWTITSEATKCEPQSNGCRQYSGNNGSNLRKVIEDNFSDGVSTTIWSGQVEVSGEALTTGDQSMKVKGGTIRTINEGELKTDSWYELTFWAKGTGQKLIIYFAQDGAEILSNSHVSDFTYDKVNQQQVPVGISGEWKRYRFGPVQFKGNTTTPAQLNIQSTDILGASQPQYYLDNVLLMEEPDNINLIKNSWKTWVVLDDGTNYLADVLRTCDFDPTDGRPGEQLGCAKYTDSDSQPWYLTGFDKLCRKEAIGCTALYDTYNSSEHTAVVYNLLCRPKITTSTECVAEIGDQRAVCSMADSLVQAGSAKYCNIDKLTLPEGFDTSNITTSTDVSYLQASLDTIVIPADTPSSSPVFLTDYQTYRCDESKLGCQTVGAERQILPSKVKSSYEYTESYIKNDPAKYIQDDGNGILCRENLVGCKKYNYQSDEYFFKDPVFTGNSLCYFKDRSPESDTYGWFKKDIGYCYSGDKPIAPTQLCKEDKNCGDNGKCQQVGNVPCYEDYIGLGGKYGIWSQKTPEYKDGVWTPGKAGYQGLVGMCEPRYSACTELRDLQDTSQLYPQGQPYYQILNKELESQTSQCEGKASLIEGCVLFKNTENPTNIYDSSSTYALSEQKRFAGVTPITNSKNLDTNLILKVGRDRTCSEWLSCKDSYTRYDQKNSPTEVCVSFGRCLKVTTGGLCEVWANNLPLADEFLSETNYINRPFGWFAEEYTGLSLLNKYNIGTYGTVWSGTVGNPEDNKFYLAAKEENKVCKGATDWKTSCGDGGVCQKGKCIYPVTGKFNDGATESVAKSLLTESSCKAFPESDSPFSPELAAQNSTKKLNHNEMAAPSVKEIVRKEFERKQNIYGNANICQNGDCSCEYKKEKYKNSTVDYWPLATDDRQIPLGLCVAGKEEGVPCAEDNDCGVGGSCSQRKEQYTDIGQRGYCLEKDLSRPLGKDQTGLDQYACLTWLPTDVSASVMDNYNADTRTGYLPELDTKKSPGEVFCTKAMGNGTYWDKNLLSNNICKYFGNLLSLLMTPFNGYPEHLEQQSFSDWSVLDAGGTRWKLSDLAYPNHCQDSEDDYREFAAFSHFFSGNNKNTQMSNADRWDWLSDSKMIVGMVAVDCDKCIKNSINGVSCWSAKDKDESIHCLLKYFDQKLLYAYLYEYARGDLGLENFVIAHLDNPEYIQKIYKWDSKQVVTSTAMDILTGFKENDIKRIYFSPLFYPKFHGKDVGKVTLIPNVYIDFNELRSLKPTEVNGTKFTMTQRPLMDKDVKDLPEGLKDVSNRYYTFRGVIDYSGSSDQNDAKSEDNGKIMYGIVLDLGYMPLDVVKNKIAWFFNHTAYVETHETNPKIFGDWSGAFIVNPHSGEIENVPMWGPGNAWDNGDCDDKCKNNIMNNLIPWGVTGFGQIVDLNPRCTEFSVVYDSNKQPFSTNKAATNAVWRRGDYLYNAINYDVSGGKWLDTQDYSTAPFGALSIGSSEIVNRFNDYYFKQSTLDGYPFTCPDSFSAQLSIGGNIEYGPITPLCAVLKKWDIDGKYSETIVNELPNNISSSDVDNGSGIDLSRALLNELFLKTFKVYTPDNYTGKDSSIKQDKAAWDDSGSWKVNVQPPQIYSLDIHKCLESAGPCVAYEYNAFTINKRNYLKTADYNDDGVADEDKNFDGNADPLIDAGKYRAQVRFFAFADQNSMPIKRIMVDWGDGSDIFNRNTYGFYYNYKPFCDPPGQEATSDLGHCFYVNDDTQLTCKSNNDCPPDGAECKHDYVTVPGRGDEVKNLSSFGDSARACRDRYYQFNHVYNCIKESSNVISGKDLVNYKLNDDEIQSIKALGYNPDDGLCIFKPKVQVLDNWGWCNGYCIARGCYNDGTDKKCDTSDDAWLPYRGRIIVIPK